jgi:hypothetical protein
MQTHPGARTRIMFDADAALVVAIDMARKKDAKKKMTRTAFITQLLRDALVDELGVIEGYYNHKPRASGPTPRPRRRPDAE